MKLFFVSCRLSIVSKCFPVGSSVKNLPANAWAVGWIPGLGRSPGEGNGNPLQYSCLENQDRGAWRLQSIELRKNGTQLSNWTTATTIVSNRGKFLLSFKRKKGFPGGPVGKKIHMQCRRHRRQVWSLDEEDPQEKGMATHSSILDWRIPWTEEPGGLQSRGSHRVRHDWRDWAGKRKRHLENSSVFWETRHGCLKSARG